MTLLMAPLAGYITAVISALGYGGIVGLMTLESACVPLPSELIMPFSGYLVATGRFDLVMAATAGAVGCNIGSTLAYWAGARGGRPLIDRWGSKGLPGHRHVVQAEKFFARYGVATVFFGRLLPGVRTFVSLPAGVARMPMLRFQIWTFLGSWPWCFALAYAGMRLGREWQNDPALRQAMHALQGLVVVLVLAAVVVWLWRRRRVAR